VARDSLQQRKGPGFVGSIVLFVLFLIVAGWVLRVLFKIVWATLIILLLISMVPIVAGLIARSFKRPRF
jgi:CDP-diglyceride synthetase